MPMKTTLVTLPGPPGTSPARRRTAASSTWATISAEERLRWGPPWPVAQNGQAMPQPACDEMHTVARSRPGPLLGTPGTP